MTAAIGNVTDNGDGTVTVAITGAGAGNQVDVYVAIASPSGVGGTFAQVATVTGNTPATFALAQGAYIAILFEHVSLLGNYSLPYGWRVGASGAGSDDGPLLHPLNRLADMLVLSPTFAELVGEDIDDPNLADKLLRGVGGTKRVFVPEFKSDKYDLYPAAVIGFGGPGCLHWTSVAGGQQNYLRPDRGMVRLTLIGAAEALAGDIEVATKNFARVAGKIVDEINALAARDDFLAIDEADLEIQPLQPSEQEVQSLGHTYCWCSYLFIWKA